ncbi:hypothetical protein SLS53_005546 [Cytospora paraplurivora]|uniref:DUF7905 domain-containing protein n=1 Tax=Cytospora paraplurivora TaxID=2898453 RepID=A0AAN9U4S2_9PEZI
MESMHDLAVQRLAEAHGQDPRLLLSQHQNPFQKVEKSKFLGPVPEDAYGLLELQVALPCTEDGRLQLDLGDPTTRTRLAEIKVAYQVWIEPDDNFIAIYGESKANLKAALTALQVFIDSINKDIEGRTISVTAHSIAASGVPVEIKPIASNEAPYRPITKQLPAESTGPGQDLEVPHGLADKFDAAIHEASKRIRPVEGELRVRAHMGIFSLLKRRANQDTFHDDDRLVSFLKKTSDMGWSYINHRLGDETFAQRLLDMIYQTEDIDDPFACKFMGSSATILSIRDIKPKYCLVLFAKDLRIEVDVKYEPGYQQNAAAESIRAFSCARRDKVVEVVVSCPDRAFDWHLCVETEANAGRIPPEITHFVKHGLQFKRPPSEAEFLLTRMDSNLLRAAGIDKIACKVSWTFDLTQKPYRLEVSVYHEWAPELLRTPGKQWRILDTTGVPRPSKSCGIMLYSQEWDEKLQQINDPEGLQSDFAKAFPELFVENNLAFGVESFLQEVQSLHGFTDLAAVPDQL